MDELEMEVDDLNLSLAVCDKKISPEVLQLFQNDDDGKPPLLQASIAGSPPDVINALIDADTTYSRREPILKQDDDGMNLLQLAAESSSSCQLLDDVHEQDTSPRILDEDQGKQKKAKPSAPQYVGKAGLPVDDAIRCRSRPTSAEGMLAEKENADLMTEGDAQHGDKPKSAGPFELVSSDLHGELSKFSEVVKSILFLMEGHSKEGSISGDSPLVSVYGIYQRALADLLRSTQRCMRVPSSLQPPSDRGFNFHLVALHCMTQILDEMKTALLHIDSWDSKQNSLVTALNSQLPTLVGCVLKLIDIELYIFGSAIRVAHPVLQLAWALAEAPERQNSYLERSLLKNNLMDLLLREIGDSALTSMETFWEGCVVSFVSKLGDKSFDDLSVADLNRVCKQSPPSKHFLMHAGNSSVRQMLIELELCDDPKMVPWRNDSIGGTLIVKRTTLRSVEECKRSCKLVIPHLKLFLGVDVVVVVEANDTKGEGLTVVQYQVGDRPPQDVFECYKSTSNLFTIGSSVAQPGDEIHIFVTGPLIKNDSSISLRVVHASAVVLTSGTQDNADFKPQKLSSGFEEHLSTGAECIVRTAPQIDWSIIETTLHELKVRNSVTGKEWRIPFYIDSLNNFKQTAELLTKAVEMDFPSIWLKNVVRNVFEFVNRKLKRICTLLQQQTSFSRLEDETKAQLADIELIIPRLAQLEMSTFGSAIRINHPVFQRAWMLAGTNNRIILSRMSQRLLKQNLFVLLEQEIGDDALNSYDAWNKKIQSLFSEIGDQNSEDLYISDMNQVRPSPHPLENTVVEMLNNFANSSCWPPSTLAKEAIIEQRAEGSGAVNLLMSLVTKVGVLQSMPFLEQEQKEEIDIYKGALTWLLRPCRRLSVVADLIPNHLLNKILGILHLTEVVLGAFYDSLKQMDAALMEILKEQHGRLEGVLRQILDAERSIVGTGDRIRHPVLKRSWTLVCADRLHTGTIQRIHFFKILLALLQHEIGDSMFASRKAIWEGCIASLMSRISDSKCDQVYVHELNIFSIMYPPKEHFGSHSLWRLLLQTEFLCDTDMFTWRGKSRVDDLVIKQTMLVHMRHPAIIEESKCVSEFSIPEVGILLGIDVCVDVVVKEQTFDRVATVQYQVGEHPPQFACFISFKDSKCGFTIGGTAGANPGDSIKIWVTRPKVKGLVSMECCVEASAFSVIDEKQLNVGLGVARVGYD